MPDKVAYPQVLSVQIPSYNLIKRAPATAGTYRLFS